jgi:hypothetical protein
LRVLDAGVHPRSFIDERGKHPELAGSASRFTAHAGFRQTGFLNPAEGDFLNSRFDPHGDGAKESGTRFS